MLLTGLRTSQVHSDSTSVNDQQDRCKPFQYQQQRKTFPLVNRFSELNRRIRLNKTPKGTRIQVIAYLDNSDKNPNNPHNPAQTIRFTAPLVELSFIDNSRVKRHGRRL